MKQKHMLQSIILLPVLAAYMTALLWCTTETSAKTAKQTVPAQCRTNLEKIQFSDSVKFPAIKLQSDDLSVLVYAPDAKNGYYRATRFDWSGIIGRVEYKKHTFFGPWQNPHDPQNPEHGIGPCEEFDMEDPPGYEQAQGGGTFMKIGVGRLRRPAEEKKYFMNRSYTIEEHGLWEITGSKTCLEFKQNLIPKNGWGYSYTKRLHIDKSTLIIEHELANTGTQTINSEHYSHNFIIIDDSPIGENYRITFAFAPVLTEKTIRKMGDFSRMDGSTLHIQKRLESKTLWAGLGGIKGTVAENNALVENIKSGASLRIKGSLPVTRYNFYAVETAACPEPFVNLHVKPGSSVTWTISHQFATTAKK